MKKGLKIIDNSQILTQAKSEFSQYVDLDTLDEYTQNLYSKSSLLAMRSDWNRYVDFCYRKGAAIFPHHSDTIRMFLEEESRERKYASIRRYSLTLSTIYRLLSETDPLRNTQVRQLLADLRLEKAGDQKQSDAFTSTHLKYLNHSLAKSTKHRDIRDLAIFNVMFECALRRSELRELTRSQLALHDENAIITIHEFSYTLSEQATKALHLWLSLINDDLEYVFRAIDRHGNISHTNLDDSSIYRIFRRAAELLDNKSLHFSGQSARIGAAKELHKQGEKLRDIQQFGRWLSPVMPTQYVGQTAQSQNLQLRYKKFKPWN
ncbi:tyrosine-type recombinase/integrase [Vibrio viridaestus]|uniref:Integrase n=1 Tax=Vibrio viridaestus TaxID=2487322 RepID=A0A3N9TKG2_9VIBR|nr:tyrosine-type recombinase/integrase [Vibrio viridaestus]RQW64474.1 integrase [Vibrio viridaestus]